MNRTCRGARTEPLGVSRVRRGRSDRAGVHAVPLLDAVRSMRVHFRRTITKSEMSERISLVGQGEKIWRAVFAFATCTMAWC